MCQCDDRHARPRIGGQSRIPHQVSVGLAPAGPQLVSYQGTLLLPGESGKCARWVVADQSSPGWGRPDEGGTCHCWISSKIDPDSGTERIFPLTLQCDGGADRQPGLVPADSVLFEPAFNGARERTTVNQSCPVSGRSKLQFSLRSLLVLTAGVSGFCGLIAAGWPSCSSTKTQVVLTAI